MRQYSIAHPLILSFYSKALYEDVGRRWKGTGLLYLFLLVALAWIPLCVRLQVNTYVWVRDGAPEFLKQIPRITIAKGRVSIDAPSPHIITDPETGKPFAIIDLEGDASALDDSPAHLLLTKNKVFLRKSPTEVRGYDLSGIESFSLDRSIVGRWLAVAKILFAPALYLLLVPLAFFYRAIQALLYAGLGLVMARRLSVSLTYRALVRLAAVAVTPVIILTTVLEIVLVEVPYAPVVWFVVAMGYLYFAVVANGEREPMGGF